MKQNIKNIFVVGGAVRDELLGLKPKDIDYVVVGSTPEEMFLEGFEQVGADFPVFLHPISKEEFALARTERKSGKGYGGFTVDSSPDVTLEEDLARRDLTINSMAKDQEGNIIDPFNGKDDLKNKVLRHTTIAFAEDPLRVLRIARFMARYGEEWTIHPDTLSLMKQIQLSGELDNLTPERVWKETEKALSEPSPHLYFETLSDMGLFPELDAMKGVEQPPKHHPEGDVFVHTMLALKQAADLGFDVETRFAVLCHDFGKSIAFKTHGNLHGHEQMGVPEIDVFCDRFRVPSRFRQLAKLTSDNHTRCHKIFEMQPKSIYKLIVTNLVANKNPQRFEQFIHACICDAQGRGPTKINEPYPQADFARKMLKSVMSVNTKLVAQLAINSGKSGEAVGEAIKVAQISAIRRSLNELEHDSGFEKPNMTM